MSTKTLIKPLNHSPSLQVENTTADNIVEKPKVRIYTKEEIRKKEGKKKDEQCKIFVLIFLCFMFIFYIYILKPLSKFSALYFLFDIAGIISDIKLGSQGMSEQRNVFEYPYPIIGIFILFLYPLIWIVIKFKEFYSAKCYYIN